MCVCVCVFCMTRSTVRCECLFSVCVCLFAATADFKYSFSLLGLICSSAFTPPNMHTHMLSVVLLLINYEKKWRPPAHRQGLLSRLGTGRSGRRGQLCYGGPAGCASLGWLIDPDPAEQISACLDVTVFLSPRASDRVSDGHQTKLPARLARAEAVNAKYRCCSLIENSLPVCVGNTDTERFGISLPMLFCWRFVFFMCFAAVITQWLLSKWMPPQSCQ